MALFSERQPGTQARERSLSERIVSSVVQKIASACGLTLIAERGCDGLECICCWHLGERFRQHDESCLLRGGLLPQRPPRFSCCPLLLRPLRPQALSLDRQDLA